MSTPDLFSFNNHDVYGNESEEPESSDESDLEPIPPLLSEDFAEEDAEDDNAIDENDSDVDEADDAEESHPAQWKIETVLRTMKTVGVGVAEFLDGVSWSESVSRSNEAVKGARAQLFHKDSKLPSILKRWAIPPRSRKSHKRRPKGGSDIMNRFAVNHVKTLISGELNKLSKFMRLSPQDDVSDEALQTTNYETLSAKFTEDTPVLWDILQNSCKSCSREKWTHKDPLRVSLS